MARAGLKKVVKTVKGKKKSVRRTYWVKSSAASKKPSGLMAKARNIAGNHYLQSALIGAATGAATRVNSHNAQKKDGDGYVQIGAQEGRKDRKRAVRQDVQAHISSACNDGWLQARSALQ